MKKNKFPKNWNEDRVRKVLAHYEKQTEEEAVAEDEAAYEARTQTAMDIPVQLVLKSGNLSQSIKHYSMRGQQLIIQAKIIFAVIPIPKTSALLISGTGSGKTTVAMGLMAALGKNHKVQPFFKK